MTKNEKIIVVSGDFDPLDFEDLQFLRACRKKGNWLIVGVHSDLFLDLCRGGHFLDFKVRKEMIEALKCVDEVFAFNDADGTVINLLKLVKFCYPMSDITYISEEDMHNMPETKIRGITFEVLKQGEK